MRYLLGVVLAGVTTAGCDSAPLAVSAWCGCSVPGAAFTGIWTSLGTW